MERCKEVLAWKKTGKTEGDALRSYAKYSLLDFLSGGLQQAEKSTMDDAMMAVVELVALVEKLQARVAYLESRLEVTPEHDIDGIAARDATIHHQDGCISELKFRLAEAEDTNKALRVRLGSELERANERLVDLECELYSYADVPRERLEESRRMDELKLRVTQLEAELAAERAAPEPIQCETCQGTGKINEMLSGYSFSDPSATCPDCDGSGELESIHDRIGTPLYAAPPVITQHEPVTTVDDRHNADGKSCHITDDLPAGMPLYAAPPVAAPVRLTDSQINDASGDGILDCLCDPYDKDESGDSYSSIPHDLRRFARAIESAVLRANGFKLEGEQ